MATPERDSFAQLLYTLLVVEEVKSVKEVAAALGLKDQALYARLYGRVRLSVEEARQILRLLGDVRVADYFLNGSPYVAVDRHEETEPMEAEHVRNRATTTMFDVTDVLKEVERSLADDGRIDHREKLQIQKRLQEAERSLTALRHSLSQV